MTAIKHHQHPQVAVILLLDISGSMSGAKIDALNNGLLVFKKDVEKDGLKSKSVDLAVVTFSDDLRVISDFSSIDKFNPQTLNASGPACMGDAILKAAEMIETRKAQYRQNAVDYYRPLIVMITDGEATDMEIGDAKWSQVVNVVNDGEKNKKFIFFAIAVEPSNTTSLKDIAPVNRPPIKLNEMNSGEYFPAFLWVKQPSPSRPPGDKVTLESPMEAGWGTLET